MTGYWLVKTEGECYSIDDLKRDKAIAWTGIRNYQARNFMRDSMRVGDMVLVYHSNGTPQSPTGVYGIAKVSGKPHADATQFDKKDEHYDPKSKNDLPTWVCVELKFVKKFKAPVTLEEIKRDPNLKDMGVRQRGSRLSVMPVSEKDYLRIVEHSAHE